MFLFLNSQTKKFEFEFENPMPPQSPTFLLFLPGSRWLRKAIKGLFEATTILHDEIHASV